MGKTKTSFVGGVTESKVTGAEKYKLRQQKKAQEETAVQKEAVKGVGLKGGEKVKVVEGQMPEIASTLEESKAGLSPKARRGTRIRGKKYLALKASVSKDKKYSIKEAIELVKKTSYVKFDATVEFHATMKKSDINTQVTLPFSAGKAKKVEVADDATLQKLEKGKVDFDILLATAEMMPKLVKFAKILGPKGMMPNPKNGTLIKSKEDAKKFSGNTVAIKSEKKAPLVHLAVGKVSQAENELKENLETVIKVLDPKLIEKAHLTSTMGPGIKLAL